MFIQLPEIMQSAEANNSNQYQFNNSNNNKNFNNDYLYNENEPKAAAYSYLKYYFVSMLQPSDNKLAMKLFGSKKGVLKVFFCCLFIYLNLYDNNLNKRYQFFRQQKCKPQHQFTC